MFIITLLAEEMRPSGPAAVHVLRVADEGTAQPTLSGYACMRFLRVSRAGFQSSCASLSTTTV